MSNLFDLHGKNVVVTGASEGGLGYFSALGLAAQGANLFVSDLADNADALNRTVEAVIQAGGKAAAHFADVSSEAEVDGLVSAAEDYFGAVDVLTHQAGVMLRKEALLTPLSEWERVLQINLTGTFLVNRGFAAGMLKRGRGKIINTSTIYTNIVGPLPESAYYASKAGVANLTRGFAAEWGRSGINVNCIAPGTFFPTRMTASLADQPERLDAMRARTLLGRLGDPGKDLAGTVIWLASSASDYVTGQVIFVDGGWTAN